MHDDPALALIQINRFAGQRGFDRRAILKAVGANSSRGASA
jgi:hypothetical protein